MINPMICEHCKDDARLSRAFATVGENVLLRKRVAERGMFAFMLRTPTELNIDRNVGWNAAMSFEIVPLRLREHALHNRKNR